MFYYKTRFYVPKWRKWLNNDSAQYLDVENAGCANLYAYCNNNPVMYSDGDGHYSKPADWLNFANFFGLASAIGQFMINGAYIGSYFRIANAVRPANIGVGIWNKGRSAALKSFGDIDAPKFQKASNILGTITVGVQVLGAGMSDYNRGYSTDRIISNAVVNTAIYSATTLGCSYIGGLVGSLIPIPIVGTAIGTAVGYVVGVGIDFLLELEINGKSIIDYVRDGIYNFWKNLFD